MGLFSIRIFPPCPHCGNIKTGWIKPRTMSDKRELYFLLKNLKSGVYVKYVDEQLYAKYYKKFGINMYCENCSYEFKGRITKASSDDEEAVKYQEEMGFENTVKTMMKPKKVFVTEVLQKFIRKKEINKNLRNYKQGGNKLYI